MSIEPDRNEITLATHGENDESQLPQPKFPPDRGAHAWKFLIGCFLIEAIIWGKMKLIISINYADLDSGFNIAFGVFQQHYSTLPQFKGDHNIPVIGTVATSMIFLGTPFTTPFVIKYHRWRQSMVIAGVVLCVAGLVWASFANSVAELIASQGALYGIGVLVLYTPLVSMLNEWFIERRGLAYGVMFAGGGVGGVGLPFLMEWLLATYGYRTTFRVTAIAQTILLAPVLPLIRGRLPSSRNAPKIVVEFDFVRNPQFWILMVSNVLQGFAIYIPSIYLPTYATQVGLSRQVGALLLAALNIASTVGQVVFGHLSDRYNNIFLLLFITTFVSAAGAFCIWGFAHSVAPLLVFAIVWGFFGGSYVVFWPKFALLSKDPLFLYGLMAFGKGIGNVASGPITSRLLSLPVSSGYGLGTYKQVIIYTGALLLASSAGVIGWPVKRIATRRQCRDDRRSM